MAMQESNGFLGMRRAFASDSESVLSFVPSREATCVVLIALSEAELTRSGKAVDLCYRSHPAPYLPLLLAAGNQEADIIVASGKLGLLTQPWCDVDPAVHAVVHDCLSTCQGSTGSNVREGNEQRVQAVPRQEQHPPARPFALGRVLRAGASWSLTGWRHSRRGRGRGIKAAALLLGRGGVSAASAAMAAAKSKQAEISMAVGSLITSPVKEPRRYVTERM